MGLVFGTQGETVGLLTLAWSSVPRWRVLAIVLASGLVLRDPERGDWPARSSTECWRDRSSVGERAHVFTVMARCARFTSSPLVRLAWGTYGVVTLSVYLSIEFRDPHPVFSGWVLDTRVPVGRFLSEDEFNSFGG